MEDMVAASTPAKVLSMHHNSPLISKFKPKIRIVHIFAPEIIKTDPANFRELVQRLTGKPTAEKNMKGKGKSKKTKKLPCRIKSTEERMKEEENEMMIWSTGDGSTISSGDFFDGFKDLDCFINQELSGESPNHHDMDVHVLDQVEDIHFSM